MQRQCESCGKGYETASKRSRFCSSTCRSRAHRGQPGVVGLVVTSSSSPAAADGELVASVEKKLREAGRLDSFDGQAAVDIARRIEAAPRAPLSQAAAAHRELRAAVAQAVRGAKVAKSAVEKHRDELAERRNRQRA